MPAASALSDGGDWGAPKPGVVISLDITLWRRQTYMNPQNASLNACMPQRVMQAVADGARFRQILRAIARFSRLHAHMYAAQSRNTVQ